MSLLKPKNKKNCDPKCPYDCKECAREGKWLKALEREERKEMKRFARKECKTGWSHKRGE